MVFEFEFCGLIAVRHGTEGEGEKGEKNVGGGESRKKNTIFFSMISNRSGCRSEQLLCEVLTM